MELRQLKTFHTVATLLSFHGAARALNYAQSTVSAQIQALEDDINVKLFERLGKRITLTPAGTNLLEYAKKMLDLEQEARGEVGGGPGATSLNVRMPESMSRLYIRQLLQNVNKIIPDLHLSVAACAYHGLQEDLRKGVTDVAFLWADTFTAAHLEMEALGWEKVVFVAGRNHPLAGRLAVSTAEIMDGTLLLSQAECSYRKPLEALLAGQEIAPTRILEPGGLTTLLHLVETGCGVTMLPERLARIESAAGRLAVLDWEEGSFEVAAMMIRHQDKWMSPALEAFMDAAKQVMT